MNDEFFIKRCIELARKAMGNTYPNPLVGSVIVHNGKIIGEGYHQKAGENHAEINAIESVKDKSLLPESTIYVSLEPCAHFGKTPPCALKIIEVGFKKVVIGALDSHDKVNGKGKKLIADAGIEVISGILEEECIDLNKRFFTYHDKKRPYIILKWAQSKDNFIDKEFKPTAISNTLINQIVHQLRADEHSILVGTQTALNDNPSLTVRNIEGKNPIRILVDFELKVPQDSNIYNNDAETLIFNGIKNESFNHLKFIKISKENAIHEIMEKLHENQIQSVIVEGGAKTIQNFIDSGIWDEAIVIKNEKLELQNGTKAPFINDKAHSIENFRDNTIEFYTN